MRLNKLLFFILLSFVIFSSSILLSQTNKSYHHISYIFSGGGGIRESDSYSQFDVNCEGISGYRYSTNYMQIDGFLSCDSIQVKDTIYVSIHDTIAYYNTTFFYPVYVSNTDSVDPQVEAYAFTLAYDDSTLLKATGVETDGTLTEDDWITIVDTSVCGQITVAGASVGYLSGEGKLVFIEFDVYSPSKNDSIVNLQVTQFLFNEGNPIANIDSASAVLNIKLTPGIDDPENPFYLCLYQNFPNPIKEKSTIKFGLPKPSVVKLQIYNLKGQLISTLIDEDKKAGYHTIEWNTGNLKSGIYFYKLSTPDKTFIKKMILLH